MIHEGEAPAPTIPSGHKPMSRIAIAAVALAIAVAIVGAMAGFGNRWGLWSFRTGFSVLRWAAYGGIATAVLGAVAVLHARPSGARRGFTAALLALAVGLLAVGIPWQYRRMGASVPPIHDITTDTENPPAFVAVAPLRADASNPITYEGETIASQQRGAYPDLRPVVLDLPFERAFQRALDAAESQGWEIVDVAPAEGRIEATDRTFWFGFLDDVVIRVTPLDGRSVIDVRSKSRVGRGDFGTNAKRVRGYLGDLN